MKPILPILLLFLLPALSFAIGPYKVGDILVVHAPSGLLLRKTADPKGERIVTIAYGEEVTVVKSDKKAHQVEEFKGYTIKGFWVKVKTKEGKEGFVFDGYLSSYPTPGKVVDDQQGAEVTTTSELFLLGKTEMKGKRIELPKLGNQYMHYRQLFKNGASAEFTGGEGGSSQSITFEKAITMEEAYLIGKGLWLEGMELEMQTFKKNVITAVSDDGLFGINVANKGGFVVLTLSHAD